MSSAFLTPSRGSGCSPGQPAPSLRSLFPFSPPPLLLPGFSSHSLSWQGRKWPGGRRIALSSPVSEEDPQLELKREAGLWEEGPSGEAQGPWEVLAGGLGCDPAGGGTPGLFGDDR